MNKFKIGDKINYSFFRGLEIVDMDAMHYMLKDKFGNTKKIYRSLINELGSLASE